MHLLILFGAISLHHVYGQSPLYLSFLVKEPSHKVLDLDCCQMLSCHRFGPRFLNDPLHKESIHHLLNHLTLLSILLFL